MSNSTELKTELFTLVDTLHSEKQKEVWDMEEVFYLDNVIRNKISETIESFIPISGSNYAFTLFHEAMTDDEINYLNTTLIHEPLPGQRPLAASEYGYISGSTI